MKRKLQQLSACLVLIATSMNAQEKVWDFGNDETNWPVNPTAITADTTVDGLTLVPGDGSGFGIVEANTAIWEDGYTSVNRFRFGGNSGIDPSNGTDFMPTRRYLTFQVDGPVSVKLWFRPGGSSVPRALYVTNGVDEVVTFYESLGDTDPHYMEANYNGGPGTLVVLCAGNAFNLNKIQISSTLLLNSDAFESEVKTEVKAIADRVYVSNVKSTSTINIYNLTGSLVKSVETNSDLDFSLDTGIYIASINSAEGQKAVKLIVQ